MSRYYSSRHTSTEPSASNGRAPRTRPPQTGNPWWRSLPIVGALLLGVGVLGATLAVEFTTQRVIHIRADDSSDSAVGYTALRQQHCQASVQHYKPGDIAIAISFADRPVTTQNISIFNSFSLLGTCSDTKRAIANKQPGTSLILLLERIQSAVEKQRARNNLNPVVATVTLQDAEPGPNQPALDFDRVRKLVSSITQNGGAIALMVENEELQNQLDTKLAEDGNVQICSFTGATECVNWAFETGRHPLSK